MAKSKKTKKKQPQINRRLSLAANIRTLSRAVVMLHLGSIETLSMHELFAEAEPEELDELNKRSVQLYNVATKLGELADAIASDQPIPDPAVGPEAPWILPDTKPDSHI